LTFPDVSEEALTSIFAVGDQVIKNKREMVFENAHEVEAFEASVKLLI
jgi:hypothetical protein